MKQKSKTGAWIRLILFSILALVLVNVLIAGITNRGNGFPFFSFGSSFRYPNSEKYTAGNNSITASQLKDMDINWVSGSIEIDTYKGKTIEITETSNGNIGEDDRVRSYYEDGILHIQFRESTFFLFGTQTPRKTLHIKIPESLACDIQNFSLDSVSSDNKISGLSMKDCDIDNVSGELTIDGTVQNFNLNTVSGSCLLTSKTAPENINSDSVSGSVTLRIPGDSGFTVEQDSVSGHFSSELPTSLSDDNYVCGDGGKGEWEFDSVSGDIRIEKIE